MNDTPSAQIGAQELDVLAREKRQGDLGDREDGLDGYVTWSMANELNHGLFRPGVLLRPKRGIMGF